MSFTAADPLQAVSQLLLASPVAAIVGNRVRPLTAATLDVRPIVTYQVVESDQFNTMTGSASWEKRLIQIDAFADTYKVAQSIIAAVKAALGNYVGIVGSVQIGVIRQKEDSDATEPADIGQENPIVRLQTNFLVLFRLNS